MKSINKKPQKKNIGSKDNIENSVDQKNISRDISKDKIIIFLIIGILIFFAIIISLRFFIKEKPEMPETKVYNGFTFVKIGNYWKTNLKVHGASGEKQFEIMFHYTPDEVENITTEKNIRNQTITPYLFMNVNKIYITTEPEYPSSVVIGGVEISKIIAQIYRKEVKGALTKPYYNYSNIPIITCEDISDEQRVIYLRLGNETKIYSDYGCIVVQGENPDMLIKASERLAYEILRIL